MIALALLAMMQAAPATAAPRPDPCYRERVDGTVRFLEYLGDRVCVDLTAPRSYDGVWIDEFEGSRFVDGARTLEDVRRDRSKVWLNRHDLLTPSKRAVGAYGRVFRVRFIGRSAKQNDRKPLEGYGHFGMSSGLVLVDEWRTLEDIGSVEDVRRKP